MERQLGEELRCHLEARTLHAIAAGTTPEEARYAALRAMDGIEQRKEECRDMRHMNLIDNLIRDIRYALRTLARTPGFTLAALLALTLGIGATTAVFSVVDAVLLRPLPYPDPERLVMIFSSSPQLGIERGGACMADFMDWRSRSRSFQTLDVFEVNRFANGRFTLTGDGEAEQFLGLSVTASFFKTLGVPPLLGRTFSTGDDEQGRPPTIVLSEHLWRRRYGSSPAILGKQIEVDGHARTVIGIMPESFEFWQRGVEAWDNQTLTPPARRGPFFVRGVARLNDGVTLEQAAAEIEVIARDLEREHPKDYSRLRFP